ncbi:MAG: glycosyltransferase family 4 protein [Anaerolineae bacterium]|nr:glycosyltransferase family 4 protein [Anaerolineae bacterium]
MRIAIDASRTTVPRLTGTEHYSRELIRALIRLQPEHEIHLYFRDSPPEDLFPPAPQVHQHVIPFKRLWTHIRFALALRSLQPDVVFVPAHTLPFAFDGRAVATVHDLGFRYFPEAHPARQRVYLDLTTAYSARRSEIVLADSQTTAADLMDFYGIPAAKIRVVYPGVDPLPIGDVAAVRAKYELPERYFLFLGTLQPRKNIAVIVQAYQRWRAANPDDGAGLVLAGAKGWLYDDRWALGLPGLHLPGYIDDADKGALYAGALALVFPSLYEGFGFPVLEAMHCGTPVITSSTSSLPELAGDAGLLADPLDVGAIVNKMTRISANGDMRQLLAEKGYRQVGRFTWARAAGQTLQALEAAAST